ncbi:hypothetical protein [Fulvivirga sp.]
MKVINNREIVGETCYDTKQDQVVIPALSLPLSADRPESIDENVSFYES